ncbi:hypothetical protein R1flu_014811 [Riccia fluitans]|uniref:Uncharacterized protein n=1 Tax=Riccia fluitans TaxID=41844 RepID=A0ABD1YHI1_9MARC
MDSPLFGGVQACTCPCSDSAAIFAGSSDFSRRSVQRAESHRYARSRQDFLGLPVDLRLPSLHELRRRRPENTRCLYSPLVESFEASRIKPLEPQREGESGSLLRTLSSPNLSLVDSSSEQAFRGGVFRRSGSDLYSYLRKDRGDEDEIRSSGPQDPVSAGDHAIRTSITDVSHDVDARRSARLRPATMSLTQSLTGVGSRAVTCAVGIAGQAPANATKLRGPLGLIMALFVTFLGLATAVQKKRLAPAVPKKVCGRCDGYGLECCDVCEGRGRILWEGKMSHMDKCPRCFGAGTKKCPRCDGSRVKKGEPPVVHRAKFLPPRLI